MNLLLLIIISIICYTLFTLSRKINDVFMLIAISIGALVNAGFFTTATNPIVSGPFVFSMSSLLYVLFLATIIIRALDYNVKDAKIMMTTAVVAIIITSIIDYFAKLSFKGEFILADFQTFLIYILSGIATVVAVLLASKVYEKLINKNKYLNIIIFILIASTIHSAIYYAGYMLIKWQWIDNFVPILLGNYISRVFFIGLAVLGYVANQKFIKPNYTK